MIICTIFKKKKFFSTKLFFNLIHILGIFLFTQTVTSSLFTYRLIVNENSEILFFEEERIESLEDKKPVEIYNCCGIFNLIRNYIKNHRPVFIYRKDSPIQFEVLNNFLVSSAPKNEYKSKVIKCGFDISYYLRLSNDIRKSPKKIDYHEFECMVKTFRSLKAILDKYAIKLLQAFFEKTFIVRNKTNRKNKCLEFAEICSPYFSSKIEFSVMKYYITALLNNFTLKCEFYENNLVLMENIADEYDVSLLDVNIPYKNILINSYTVFRTLENILEDPYTLEAFKFLLNEMNIESFVINRGYGCIIPDISFSFRTISIKIFRAITISDFASSYGSFLLQLDSAIGKNIEYITLKCISLSIDTLKILLNKTMIKGLVLHRVNTPESLNFTPIGEFFYDRLEYINFYGVSTENKWWADFFNRAKFKKIIIKFDKDYADKNFITEFYKISEIRRDVLYFDVNFHCEKISNEFCQALKCFVNLQTLKLNVYIIDYSSNRNIIETVESLKNLEFITIIQRKSVYEVSESHILPSKKSNIKYLHLENIHSTDKYMYRNFFQNNRSLNKIVQVKSRISQYELEEIFALENLDSLSLTLNYFGYDTCPSKMQNIMSTKIVCLNLSGNGSKFLEHFGILGKLDCLQYLKFSDCGFKEGFLKNINEKCSLRMLSLFYIRGSLDIFDFEGIKKLECLESLNISRCKLLNCSFHQLFENCKFVKSLRRLYLSHVSLNEQDLQCLKTFINLKELSLNLDQFDLPTVHYYLIAIPLKLYISSFVAKKEEGFEKFREYLRSKNINIISRYDCFEDKF
ncbi:hypothetical protein CWI38_0475p0010 [Hamiltosporidium tvaerminnensis]|uniref:Leucine-rich repeat-containing protein n=1 Tax=Hamiltosporidium tvaerminnensis TaxID=1176355 RepID=A0A4Q9LZV4_9MICR|nr:hypothetical protein CWI38_0475p0010 [Hamiltosporidium tvaerminnensis]